MDSKKNNKKLMIIIAIAVVIIVAIIGVVIFVNSRKIKLTNENYTDYLKVTPTIVTGSEYKYRDGIYTIDTGCVTEIYLSVDVKGTSNNFDYKDVEVDINFGGIIPLYEKNYSKYEKTPVKTTEFHPVNEVITIKCDIAGNKKDGQKIRIEVPKEDFYFNKEDVTVEKLVKAINVRGSVVK